MLTQLMVVGGVAENMALKQCQPCQLPGKPGMLQLLHWSVPSLLALGGDGDGVGDSSFSPEWPGAEVEEGEEDQAVGRTR